MPHESKLKRRASAILLLLAAALVVTGCGRFAGYHQRAERHLNAGEYEEARQVYTEAIDANDNPAIAYANRCLANESLGDYESAVRDCTQSLELAAEAGDGVDYTRWEVLNNRAVAYLGMGMTAEAMDDLDAAIELKPDYAEAYANRGRIHLDDEAFELAIADLDRAIELDPELAEAYGNRGLAYESMGDDEQAIADYTRAIQLTNDPQALFNRAMLRYTLGYFDDAYDDFVEVVETAEGTYLAHKAQVQVDLLENRPQGFDPVTETTAEP